MPKPESVQHVVEHVRTASVWSADVLLEVSDDGAVVRLTLTQGPQRIGISRSKAQWEEIRAQWNQSS